MPCNFFKKDLLQRHILGELKLSMVKTESDNTECHLRIHEGCMEAQYAVRPSLMKNLCYWALKREKKRNCVNTLKCVKKNSKRDV